MGRDPLVENSRIEQNHSIVFVVIDSNKFEANCILKTDDGSALPHSLWISFWRQHIDAHIINPDDGWTTSVVEGECRSDTGRLRFTSPSLLPRQDLFYGGLRKADTGRLAYITVISTFLISGSVSIW